MLAEILALIELGIGSKRKLELLPILIENLFFWFVFIFIVWEFAQMTAFLSIKSGRPDRQCVIKHLDSLSEEYLQKCHLPFRICWEQEIKEAGSFVE